MWISDYKGSWALVTGASKGIGREFCYHLAHHGLNIVLVARGRVPLSDLATELRAKHNIETLVAPMDLSQDRSCQLLVEKLQHQSIKIRLLINNAAIGQLGAFTALPLATVLHTVRLNVLTPTELLHRLKNDLTYFPSSTVINVSSQAALNPMPYHSIYGASKAYLQSLSLATSFECKDQGISIQTLIPGPTKTSFHPGFEISDHNYFNWDTPTKAVGASLSKKGPLVVTASGVFNQRLFAFAAPLRLLLKVVANISLIQIRSYQKKNRNCKDSKNIIA